MDVTVYHNPACGTSRSVLAMLEERGHILETLKTLLDAVNHASTEQRGAIDALVASSADLLERVGSRFTEQLEVETGKMGEVAAQLTGSAVEVASLGEAFGHAVRLVHAGAVLVRHLAGGDVAQLRALRRTCLEAKAAVGAHRARQVGRPAIARGVRDAEAGRQVQLRRAARPPRPVRPVP